MGSGWEARRLEDQRLITHRPLGSFLAPGLVNIALPDQATSAPGAQDGGLDAGHGWLDGWMAEGLDVEVCRGWHAMRAYTLDGLQPQDEDEELGDLAGCSLPISRSHNLPRRVQLASQPTSHQANKPTSQYHVRPPSLAVCSDERGKVSMQCLILVGVSIGH